MELATFKVYRWRKRWRHWPQETFLFNIKEPSEMKMTKPDYWDYRQVSERVAEVYSTRKPRKYKHEFSSLIHLWDGNDWRQWRGVVREPKR